MKRAIAAQGHKGSPPLPRQRRALRAVQLTVLGVSIALGRMAMDSWERYNADRVELDDFLGLAGSALVFLVLALWMGLRTVRGPQPPALD